MCKMLKNLLVDQIKYTIKLLDDKYKRSGEVIILEYTNMYKEVLTSIENDDSNDSVKMKALRLLNLTRGYMESSSDYQQKFLDEMYKTEKLIRSF